MVDGILHFMTVYKPDADVTIVSSDSVRFKIHQQNITVNSRAFPSSERGSDKEGNEVFLPEKGYILDLLFRFVYPHHYPELVSLKIDILSQLADAAEKYEVYGAISLCKATMQYVVLPKPSSCRRLMTEFYKDGDVRLSG